MRIVSTVSISSYLQVSLYADLEGLAGVGQFSVPITGESGSVLHADSQTALYRQRAGGESVSKRDEPKTRPDPTPQARSGKGDLVHFPGRHRHERPQNAQLDGVVPIFYAFFNDRWTPQDLQRSKTFKAQHVFRSAFALRDQRLQKRSEQAFSPEPNIVYELKKPQVFR